MTTCDCGADASSWWPLWLLRASARFSIAAGMVLVVLRCGGDPDPTLLPPKRDACLALIGAIQEQAPELLGTAEMPEDDLLAGVLLDTVIKRWAANQPRLLVVADGLEYGVFLYSSVGARDRELRARHAQEFLHSVVRVMALPGEVMTTHVMLFSRMIGHGAPEEARDPGQRPALPTPK